ncbi:MAG: tetratricopeptide repeat protein [Myxococcales bacterium]|nr:tetratricopeptide repeat protein [Myxococcales bacterium]MCB9671840.1 tetratricopeptide repeat protein [Alphaproteobacteria bacterium]MCB9693814.1 tetratricopeptide repeat protein [Alphaproteobacteria bacterium]
MIALLLSLAPALALDPESLRAKEELGLEPTVAQEIRDGLELLYQRKYTDARDHFADLEKRHPTDAAGLGPMSDLLVWQALMMENFDFRFDKQYWTSSKEARTRLEAAIQVPGNDGWEHFLLAGVTGIEAIHLMRTSKYLTALQTAFEAMDHAEKTRALSPGFTDLKLADGMYNYWRTVVTKSSGMLPDFGDHRSEGIEQMLAVERDGLFLKAPTTMSLAFTWIEEGKKEEALESCLKNRTPYPDNVINNLITGSVYVSMSKYKSAIGVFDEILEDSENNKRARYWKGIALQRSGRLEEALGEYQTYLAADYMEKDQRAQAHYRVGQIKYQQKKYLEAEEAWKTAIKVDGGHKRSKDRLDAMKAARKEGTISY